MLHVSQSCKLMPQLRLFFKLPDYQRKAILDTVAEMVAMNATGKPVPHPLPHRLTVIK